MLSFTGFRVSQVVIPSMNEFIAPPTVHCFASLAALSFLKLKSLPCRAGEVAPAQQATEGC